MQVNITATQPQKEFLDLNCKFPAFVAGFGTGKSEVMCVSAMLDSMEGGADSLVALYEPTYDLVRLILAPRMEQKLSDWGVPYRYNKSENIIYTSSGQFGDFILRTLDNPARIVGYESFRAKIDELDTLREEHAQDAFNKIIARNRQNPKTYQAITDKPVNTVSVFTTPEGFRFTYNKWKKEPAPGYEMIQAATRTNPYLPDDYIQALKDSYPEQLIEAYLEGNFVNLVGGQVYRQFDRRKNHSEEVEQEGDRLHIGMDFNVGKMSAVVHVERNGNPIATNEIFGKLDTPDMIAEIHRLYPGWRISVYPDSSGKNRKSVNASETDIQCLEEQGWQVYFDSANPPVRDRVNAMNAMFCNGNAERRYLINTNRCPLYTDDLEQQVYNDKGEPDKQHDKDHRPDAAGYYIAYAFPIIRPITKASVRWRT